ncbi:MAG: glycosyltransferase family 9 protein [Armatimonadetes bacterium]|nr:glycosyltransferase family 9 protein [Armatimonadota bacterium]
MPILTPTEDLKRILVCRTDGLGDVILTLPIAAAIKERLPNAEVAFLAKPYTAPILNRISEVGKVLTVTEMRKGLHLMKIYQPNAVIFAKPEFRLALDALRARIDVRIGTGYRWYSGLFTRWVYDHRKGGQKHESQYGVNLLSPLLPGGELSVRMPRLKVAPSAAAEAKSRLQALGVVGEYMVIHPGSRGHASDYSPEGFAAVADSLLADWSALNIVITAGPDEEELVTKITSQMRNRARVHAVGEMSLDVFSELLRGAKGFLGTSSGPIHLASLVKTPVVGLYPGLPPMWPARWGPIGEQVTTIVPHANESFCPRCEKDHQPENCVLRIKPDRVVTACMDMLIGKGAGLRDSIA